MARPTRLRRSTSRAYRSERVSAPRRLRWFDADRAQSRNRARRYRATKMETMTENWDHEVDVLVVGTGAGGMTAALKAHDDGGEVLLIEKTSQYGGSSAMSSCLLWLPNNHLMPGLGIEDSREEALEYLRGTTEGAIAEARLESFCDNGPKMLRYLVDETRVEVVGLPEYPDYYPAVSGSKPGGRSVEPQHFDAKLLGEDFLNLRAQNRQMQVVGRLGMTAVEARMVLTGQPGGMTLFAKLILKYVMDIPWRFRSRRDRNPSGGNALIGMLRLSLRDRNVPIWLQTPARDILIEDGRVVGGEDVLRRPLRARGQLPAGRMLHAAATMRVPCAHRAA